MKAIVAVDSNWGIGCSGKLLFNIPEDLKFFKEKTLGKVVVMGRETLESLPGREPLKDRVNIVLSRNISFSKDGVIVCHSLEDLFAELNKYDSGDVFVIGGESVYSQLLMYCTEAYVTKVQGMRAADRHFMRLDDEEDWKTVWSSELKTFRDVQFRFIKYEHINKITNYN